ncbi:MAG TPA: Ig-like domain-containing protein, partial [Gemmatimonadales bacterium]
MIALKLARTLVLGSALAFAACGGEGLVLPPEGEPAHISVVYGDEQTGRAGTVLADSVVVRVTDTKDRPVAGATVNFTFPDNDAQAAPSTGTTNSDGVTWVKVTLGAPVGPVTGVAEVPVDAGFTPVRVEFTATTLAGDANGIAAVSGDNQTGPVNSQLPLPLVVRVTDESGNPIPNQPVVWSVPSNGGGGSVSPTNTVTDANGEASAVRTLGPTAGQQFTLATSGGLAGSPVTFAHTAMPGGAAGVNKVSGDGQSAQAGTELRDPLVVRVLDAEQNPIPNRAVTWIVTGGGGSVSQENTTTNAQGEASTRWTLGPAAGPNSVNAVVSGVGTATFTATGTAGTVSPSNSSVTAAPGTITVGSGTSTVTVTVRDGSNNPVAGVSVSLASSGSGNTINPASASSNSNGVATFTFSSTVAESKLITAVAGGVTIDDQPTITVNKASSIVEITSDEPDASTVGQPITVEFTVSGAGGTPTG